MKKKNESIRVGILAAAFNKTIVEPMINEAESCIRKAGAQVHEIWRVAGCYEIPLVADALFKARTVDILIVLGYIEKGETLHGEVMGKVVQHILVEIQLKYKKPIGIGIVGPGATLPQAEKRKMNCARSAVSAAFSNHEVTTHVLDGKKRR